MVICNQDADHEAPLLARLAVLARCMIEQQSHLQASGDTLMTHRGKCQHGLPIIDAFVITYWAAGGRSLRDCAPRLAKAYFMPALSASLHDRQRTPAASGSQDTFCVSPGNRYLCKSIRKEITCASEQ